MTSENITPAVASAIHALVQNIIDNWNRLECESIEAFNSEFPHMERPKPELCTLAEVMADLASDNLVGVNATASVVRQVKAAVLQAVNTVSPFDPWPDLTRKELRFLVGRRHVPAGSGLYDAASNLYDEEEALSLVEKFAAVRHRAWLEKDADKRREKLAKAKAIVAAMEGRAA